MLEFNLLAPVRSRRRVDGLLAAGVLVVLMAGLATWGYVLVTHVNALRRDLITATQDVARLRLTARHVRQLSLDAERLRLRRALFQQAQAVQMPASQILEVIRSAMPHDVWLTSVVMRPSDATLDGYTLSYPSVARFMIALEDSRKIRHVNLSISHRETVAEQEVIKFRITADLLSTHSLIPRREAAP